MEENTAPTTGQREHFALTAALEENERLRRALERIAKWTGEFPETGHYYDDAKTQPMSYGTAYGSNGERDYMRQIAADALKGPQ
jgi:hypothetical protein